MDKRTLGSTDIEVTRLALGGLFVASFAAELDEAKRTVRRALDLGVNYIDTAPGYGNSEEVLGKALSEVDTDCFIATKLGGRPQPFDPRDRDGLWASLEESLRLLGRDQIDVLLIHEPDRPGQYDWFESWDDFTGPVTDVLGEAKDRGLIRYTGLGGTTAYPMARIIEKGDFDIVLTAFNYSLLWREAALEVIPAAKKKGMGIIAGSPLQQGWLARRFDDVVRDNPPAWLAASRREQLLALYRCVDELGMPLPELALRFVFSNPDVDCVLMGTRSAKEVELNVAAAEAGPLAADVMTRLDEIGAMVPCRPFEEPFSCHLGNPGYRGPGIAR